MRQESACQAGDVGSIPGLGRSPRDANGKPLQYSCLESPTDRGACWATVCGVAEELDRTEQLNNYRVENNLHLKYSRNILLYSKWITNKDLLYSTWNSQCCDGLDCGAGWGGVGGGWIHIHVWLNPFAVPLKLPLHC